MDQRSELLLWNFDSGLSQTEKGHNSLAGVSTNHGDNSLRRIFLARDVLNESLGTNDIESGHTEQTLWVENTGLLHDLGGDRNR